MATDDAPLSISTIIHMLNIKLNSTNYLLWSKQMLPLLTYQQLLPYVDGSSPKPAATIVSGDTSTANPVYAKWIAANQKALLSFKLLCLKKLWPKP